MSSFSDRWGPGYSKAELDASQEQFGIRFPPDLYDLFRERRPLGGHDWVNDAADIADMLKWPLEGILFDVEHNQLWWPEWGEKPLCELGRAQVVTDIVLTAPKLIPLYSHRFIPEEPHERGNPVFSVHQADIIHYGSDLTNYFENEFSSPHQFVLGPNIKQIRFWSEMVDRNGLFSG